MNNIRLLTYPDPFKLKNNKEMWDIISYYPHFCATDTLVQGLETEYERNSFSYLRSVEVLLKKLFKGFIDNPKNDIQLFLDVSSAIRELEFKNGTKEENEKLRNTFRFNIHYIVESVRILLILGIETDKFMNLTKEQDTLLEVYKLVIKKKGVQEFYGLKEINKHKYIQAIKATLDEEIIYISNRLSEMDNNFKIDNNLQAKVISKELERYLIEKMDEPVTFGNLDRRSIYKGYIDKLKHIGHLYKVDDAERFNKIIIHGVHRITPIIYYLIKFLDKLEIEVIILFNYSKNLTNVYKTWLNVYEWCNVEIENAEDLDLDCGNPLGQIIANLIEGNQIDISSIKDYKLKSFDNISSFIQREIKGTFESASENLSRMNKQYYAVRGDSSNELLRIYFPEQYGEKPFLSYPIGQFILGIYNMWDFEKGIMKLNFTFLSECVVAGIFVTDTNLLQIINKVKLFFSDIETVDEYETRIQILTNAIDFINQNPKYSSLKKLSFFDVTKEDINEFKAFILYIKEISGDLFSTGNTNVDFGEHFKKLMDIISKPLVDNATLTQTEIQLINELNVKLSMVKKGEVEGNIEDLKNAIAFYLAAKLKKNSNWIVRDFDQLDGGVLMNRRTKARSYHFAMLSNSQMMKQPEDILPWPLSTNMFSGYIENDSSIHVINKGLLEMRNYLRYSLFYGIFFTNRDIELSYVKETQGKEDIPYYLLSILGLTPESYVEGNGTFRTPARDIPRNMNFNIDYLTTEDKELYSICPFKYSQRTVLNAPIEYYSEYHIKYYISNFLVFLIKDKYDLKRLNEIQVKAYLYDEINVLKELIPFWNDVILNDIFDSAWVILKKDLVDRSYKTRQTYRRRKENFLIAKWDNSMVFTKEGLDEEIEKYMRSSKLYPDRDEIPHIKVCENCNYGDICLRSYYEANSHQE